MSQSLLWVWLLQFHPSVPPRPPPLSLCLSLYPGCSGPLGMEGGIISNQQITASSTHRALFGLQKWYPYFARLNKKGLVNAWTAAENDRWPWIQVKHLHSTGSVQSRARARDKWTKTQTGRIQCEHAPFAVSVFIYLFFTFLKCPSCANRGSLCWEVICSSSTAGPGVNGWHGGTSGEGQHKLRPEGPTDAGAVRDTVQKAVVAVSRGCS